MTVRSLQFIIPDAYESSDGKDSWIECQCTNGNCANGNIIGCPTRSEAITGQLIDDTIRRDDQPASLNKTCFGVVKFGLSQADGKRRSVIDTFS